MKKKTQDEFVKTASQKHKNKYDYSKSIYTGSQRKIIITCNKHGDFLQTAWSHLQGFGCPACSNNLKLTTQKFIERAIQKHGNKYDYSKSNYKNRYEKIKIGCKIHGFFFQTPANHMYGQGCPVCFGTFKKLSADFITDAVKKHDNIYDYSKTEYFTAHSKIKIICKIHGEFLQTPHNHLKGHGCPKCRFSRGELQIEKWLKNNYINYETQKTFDDLRNPKTNKKLTFDFYIPSKNLLIEYDGEQHFKCVNHKKYKMTMEDLKNNMERDKIKTEYARSNKIQLLRIPYTDFLIINTILRKHIID